MIVHAWSVLCSRAVVDTESGNVSLQNVIEQLKILDKPKADGSLRIEMELMSSWVREDVNTPVLGEAQITVVRPSGKTKEIITYPIDLQDYERARGRVRISSMSVPEAGRYKFLVNCKIGAEDSWRCVAVAPIDVIFDTQERDDLAGSQPEA